MSQAETISCQFLVGQSFDGWVIEATLGSGGMGVVYQATHSRSGLLAALKVLAGKAAENTEMMRRFRREVRALARIRHPSVVNILQEALEHQPPYFVLELVTGGTLLGRIEQGLAAHGRGIEPEPLSRLALELAEGLEAVHAEQVVHRDIKPQNVLFGSDDHAKIADFGMARALDLTELTVGGRVMGTLPYMAPEMLRAEPVDPRTDLYQLGVTLYEAATGRRPFPGEALVGVIAGRFLPPLPPISEHAPEAPAWLQPLCERLTAHDRSDRPASSTEVLEYIRRETSKPRRHRLSAPAGTPTVGGPASRPGGLPVTPLSTPLASRPVPPLAPPRPAETAGEAGRGWTAGEALLHDVRLLSRWAVPGLTLLVVLCAAIAWHLRVSSRAQDQLAPLATHRRPAVSKGPPAAAGQRETRAASTVPSRQRKKLPGCPVLIELPDGWVAFGQGSPPASVSTAAVKAGEVVLSTREPGIWQLTAARRRVETTATAAVAPFPGLPAPLRLEFVGRESDRFGDELMLLQPGSFAGAFFPLVRGQVPQSLGMGRGRLAITEIPTAQQVAGLIGACQGPPWFELQILMQEVPGDLESFTRRLVGAAVLAEPCLAGIKVGGEFGPRSWVGTPGQFARLLERATDSIEKLAPHIEVGPPQLVVDVGRTEASGTELLRLPQFKRLKRLELRVLDIGTNWWEALAQCRRVAASAGLENLSWEVCLHRLPRGSPRRSPPVRSPAGDDLEMRELLRSTVRAISLGVQCVWFDSLRQTLHGPMLVDILSAGVDGRVWETEGAGARAFRFLLSRLATARPSPQSLPGGVQGVVLELADRRVWFLWAPDGERRTVTIPVARPAVLVAPLCPAETWAGPGPAPISVRLPRDGLLAAEVDDGLVIVEELPI